MGSNVTKCDFIWTTTGERKKKRLKYKTSSVKLRTEIVPKSTKCYRDVNLILFTIELRNPSKTAIVVVVVVVKTVLANS